MGVDQIPQFQPKFTILEYLKYLEYLELGKFRNFGNEPVHLSLGSLSSYIEWKDCRVQNVCQQQQDLSINAPEQKTGAAENYFLG